MSVSLVVLDLPPPPSVNRTRKINWRASARAASWLRAADALTMAAKAKARGLLLGFPGERVEVKVLLREDAVGLDLDNGIKCLLDYLVRAEVISDDRKRFLRRLVVEWCDAGDAPEGVRLLVSRAS